jgi:hypothetical protein
MNAIRIAMLKKLFGKGGGDGTVKNQHKTFIANGVYRADSGYTGLGTVTVAVPEKVPILQEKTATENGEVTADDGYDGLSKVTVNVEGGSAGGGSTGGVNKLAQVVDRTVTELTAEDLQGATKLGTYAFHECKKLASINIPEGVITTGNQLFYDCTSLVSICFPKSVTSLGGALIWYCDKVRSITMKSTTPPTIQSNTFNYTTSNNNQLPTGCVITVPIGSGDAYKSATNWSSLADRIVEESGESSTNWLFHNEDITYPRSDLPGLTAGVSYTCFVNGEEIATIVWDGEYGADFTTEDYRVWVQYTPDTGYGNSWQFHGVESQVQSGTCSIRING